ncbi:MAG: flavin-dependent oxidoreductase [Rhodobacter sp.]|nr:flavin-dependent oxidoreductase [Rhodobacter sp.]
MNDKRPVLIAGGGIGGLALGLTLQQIGVPFLLLEAVRRLEPLGVGINLQPNAVRELFDLGIGAAALDTVGIEAREWALVGKNGSDIHAEPRGREAGYFWPQYAVHRGRLQRLLYETLLARAGPDALRLGQRVTGYTVENDGVSVSIEAADGARTQAEGRLLVGADGIHSAIRAQMHADQPPIHWGGAIMWRGTTQARPLRTGSSFIGLGTMDQRMVIYPITPPDPGTGLAMTNWIAEVTVDPGQGWHGTSWFGTAEASDFVHHFADWRYDWLDVTALIEAADVVYENPMIDRDPVPTWVDGPVALLGDAAHAMYPTGSNGASQAIVDARVLGAALLRHGVSAAALAAYDAQLCGPISEVVLRNRGAGPFGLLGLVDDRCGGAFDDIDAVIPTEERAAFLKGYKEAAGFDVARVNAAAPTIPPGARVS